MLLDYQRNTRAYLEAQLAEVSGMRSVVSGRIEELESLRNSALDCQQATPVEMLKFEERPTQHDERLNDESLNDERLNDESLNDESLNDERQHDERQHDERLNDERQNDERQNDERHSPPNGWRNESQSPASSPFKKISGQEFQNIL
eukprot:GHVO01050617.1.p1 GENE.GHVO01050617.1~~GHVO01050617.1.p1  ORF type:complete len:147 (+),score=16.66 GHVO01050617.1:107-547(+)